MNIGEKLSIPSLNGVPSYEVLEVTLPEDDDFLKVVETLTRIGVPSNREKRLVQSVHILHRQGRYYLLHFLELFAIANRNSQVTEEDIKRRNLIAKLLQQWGLVEVVNKDILKNCAPSSSIKVIPFKEKNQWVLEKKYTMLADKKRMDREREASNG